MFTEWGGGGGGIFNAVEMGSFAKAVEWGKGGKLLE